MNIVKQLIKLAASVQTNKKVQQILNALVDFNTIGIDYRKKDGSFESYVIIPLQIKNKNKKLVLYAEDVDENNQTKSFIVNKILKVRNHNRDNKNIHTIKIDQ